MGNVAIVSAKALTCTSLHLTDTRMLRFAKNFQLEMLSVNFSAREINSHKHNVSNDFYSVDTTLFMTSET